MTHKISAALLGPSPVIYNRLSRILAQHLDVLHDRNQMALYTATFFYLSVLVYLSQVVTGKIRPRLFIAVNLCLWLIYISIVLYTCIFNIMEENKNNHGQKVPTVCYLKKIFFSVFFIVNKPYFSKVFWSYFCRIKKKRKKNKIKKRWILKNVDRLRQIWFNILK